MTDEYVTNGRVALDLNRIQDRIEVDYTPVTASTQLRVKALLDAGAAAPVVALTDEQTLGRGRLDRVWSAPACSSVLMSVGLPMSAYDSTFTIRVGVAVAEALAVQGVAVQLKWPNDVVVVREGVVRKLGGILAEQHGDHVVVGIGLNVHLDDAELPTAEAISCRQLGAALDREQVIVGIVERLVATAPASGLAAYRERCVTIGADVMVTRVVGNPLRGKAIGVGEDGALIVRDDKNHEHHVTVGDVQHVRPQELRA